MRCYFGYDNEACLRVVAVDGGRVDGIQRVQRLTRSMLDEDVKWWDFRSCDVTLTASPEIVALVTGKERNMQYQVVRDGANACVRCREWDFEEETWSGFIWADLPSILWSKREELLNDSELHRLIVRYEKPQPIMPEHEYYAIGQNGDWYHVNCAVPVFFNGRREILIKYLTGESTDWKDDDGCALEAIHSDTITGEMFPDDFFRELNRMKCAYCKNRIMG